MEFKSKARTCFFLQDGAEDAARFYTSILPDSEIDAVYRPDPNGPALVVEFTIAGVPYMTMNGNPEFRSSHSSSVSVLTEDQKETDRLWEQLLADGGEEGQCGWLKDRYGIYWQVVPKALPRLMHEGNAEVSGRVSTALREMKKIDIATLESVAGAK